MTPLFRLGQLIFLALGLLVAIRFILFFTYKAQKIHGVGLLSSNLDIENWSDLSSEAFTRSRHYHPWA